VDNLVGKKVGQLLVEDTGSFGKKLARNSARSKNKKQV
jgi:hypothetical protein